MPEEMVCIALELSGTGSRGVEIEGSEGNSGSPGLKYVCIRYRRIREGKQVHLQLIYNVEDSGGFRSTGARGNKFTWLKYPAPEDSGVYLETVETGSPGYPILEDSTDLEARG